ncbi:DUF4202 family protein [Patescibacteria group bacterium]|nr:DUF4202 family protein [Patescibacteria group bacterium]
MSTKLYKKAEQFVVDAFKKIGNEGGIKHFLRTVYWIKQLRPNADEALLISAVAHDIQRAFREKDLSKNASGNPLLNPAMLDDHQKKGAEIIADFLVKQNANQKLIDRVKMLVSKHEVGGNTDQNLLKDADSISFFENNAGHFIEKLVPLFGKKVIKEKFDWMYERITSKKAQQIAQPMYEKALKKLKESKI